MYVKPQLASKINLTPHPSKKSKQSENKYKKPFYTWITLLGEKQTFLKKNYFILRAREERAFNLHSAGYRI